MQLVRDILIFPSLTKASAITDAVLTVRFHFLCSSPRDNLRKGTIGAVVQHFFAWRVYMMTKKVFIVLAVILCSLVNLTGSPGATIRVAVNPNLSELPRPAVEVTMWLVGAVLADMIIAVSLIWHLRRYKHFYPALTSIINRILRMTVQTGVLTTINSGITTHELHVIQPECSQSTEIRWIVRARTELWGCWHSSIDCVSITNYTAGDDRRGR